MGTMPTLNAQYIICGFVKVTDCDLLDEENNNLIGTKSVGVEMFLSLLGIDKIFNKRHC